MSKLKFFSSLLMKMNKNLITFLVSNLFFVYSFIKEVLLWQEIKSESKLIHLRGTKNK